MFFKSKQITYDKGRATVKEETIQCMVRSEPIPHVPACRWI